MAPNRRRGTKGSGGAPKTELSLGDLVLAKVKGFPAWPAKISRPEDWDRAPDPRKYFVQFFGTLEIAFVAPADIQAFTIEVKNKLSGRGRGKTQFAQAVKEICEAFDQLQEKNSVGPRDDDNDPELTTALSADGLVDDAVKGNRTDPIGNDGEYQSSAFKGSGLESCSLRQGETERQDMKPCSSSGVDGGTSPTKPTKKGIKFSNNGAKTVKEDVMSTISPCSQSFQKESVSHCGSLNNNESVHFHAAEVGCSPLEPSDHSEDRDDVQKDLTNGHRPRLASGSKRRFDGSNEMHHSNINRPASTRPSGAHVPVKFASGAKDLAQNDFRLGLGSDSEKRPKKLLKGKKSFEVGEKPRVDSKESFEESKGEFSSKKQGHGKQTNEHSHPAKRSKHVNMEDDTPKALLQTSRKLDSQSHGDKLQSAEVKSNLLVGKAESRSSTKPLSTTSDSTLGGDEDILPPTKRRRRAMEAMSGSSALGSENRIGKSSVGHKNDMSRRRAVRLCDDDEDEEPKTPIHGGSAKKALAPLHGQASTKRADNDPLGKKDSVTLDDISLKKLLPSVDRPNESSSPFPQQNEEKQQFKTAASRASFSPGKVDSEKVSSKDAKLVPLSPKRSPNAASKAVADSLKANKHASKVPGSNTLKKVVSASKIAGATDNLSSDNQPPSDRSKLGFSGERNKDPTLMAGNLMDIHFLPGERSQTGKDDKLSSIDQKVLDSAMSMRHLIAAAQAKRRQAHLQNFNGNSGSHIDVQVMSPSPTSVAQPLASSNMQLDAQGIVSHSSITSPPDVHQNSSFNQHDNEEFVERRASSGHHAAGGSLSGGTEAAVARDAFEGMIETLSRTKESIGRATRLAIDCAKYGIANEVVELLIRKLENEPSFHRKVDLFFLVDSITQCSHSHKGIAGASYIPAVQAALPRLLGAAAPSGSGARENRRQCLKVLRLWLERKILPESLVRRYMDDIGGLNDDSSGFSLRRPSRAERAIDDPIREMEGMLVDEYGSNATFQLPGFFASHAFHEDDEEEDDFPDCSSKGVLDISPSEHTPLTGDPENHTVTANERRHHILEDVDGELEMEDVSGHQKDERTPFIADANSGSIRSCESETVQLPPIPEGSPPPPLDSPPTTPPLPSSQPPSPPAHPPPPPPPLPTSPSPPPPPPPLMLQPHLVHPLPIAPTMLPPPPPPPLPPQPSLVPQHMHSLPSSNLSSSVLAYQPAPVAQEIGGNPSGNPHPPLAGSASHGPSADTSARNEVFPQQAPCFVPIGVGSAREPSGYNSSRPLEYGHNDTYINPQASQPSQQFQPGNVPFAQRPLPPNPPPQNTSSHFSYPATAIRHQTAPQVQHHPPHLYPSPYSVPNFADGPRPFVPDERWRMQPNEFNADHQRAMWMPGVRSCSGPAYVQDGYFRPPSERPSAGASGFRPPAANPLPGGASVPGHGVSHMIPSRPDMSAISWRPA